MHAVHRRVATIAAVALLALPFGTVLLIPTSLAASEGITSNALAPGTIAPTVVMHRTTATCDWGPVGQRENDVPRHAQRRDQPGQLV